MPEPVRIDRVWPEPAASLDDDALAANYAAGGSPWLRMNFVSSLDGSATVDGLSGGLGDDADRRVFTILRRLCDVVLVGAGTIRAEGYDGMSVDDESARVREANGLDPQPRLAIVTNRFAFSPDDPVFTKAPRRPLVITSDAAATRRAGEFDGVADVIGCGEAEVEESRIPAALASLGMPRILCEGGPTLFAALAAAGAVDELCLTLSPLVVSGQGTRITRGTEPIMSRMRLGSVLNSGDTLLLRYLRA